MFRRLFGSMLLKRAVNLHDNWKYFKEEVERVRQEKNRVVIALIGAPGSGKSSFVRKLINKNIENLYVIDDLKDMYGRRLSVNDVNSIVKNFKGGVLILSDYRAAVYLKDLDIIIAVAVSEDKRYENLRSRKSRKKIYRGFLYRYPPIPFKFFNKPMFIIS